MPSLLDRLLHRDPSTTPEDRDPELRETKDALGHEVVRARTERRRALRVSESLLDDATLRAVLARDGPARAIREAQRRLAEGG